MPSPRCDWRCDVCEERWELPLTAKSCPDGDCPGLLHRIWDSEGSPRIGKAQFFRVNKMLDHGQHARKPDVTPELRRQMAAVNGQPAFVQNQAPANDFAPHFSPMTRGFASTLGAATGRGVSETGGGKPRPVDFGGSGFAEPVIAAAQATQRLRPGAQTLVDRASEAQGAAMRAASAKAAKRPEGK